MSNTDRKFLELSAGYYHKTIIKGWEKLYQKKRKYLFDQLKQFFYGKDVLELGCADGEMTQWLAKHFQTVTVVDGSLTFLKKARSRIRANNVKFHHSLFETFETKRRFGTIMMAHILEHLENPVAILKKAANWLSDKGKILIAVPNANSLHRQVGVKMGLLSHKGALNKQDKILGHRRVYTPRLLKQHIHQAGLHIIKFGGCMLKPISNRQIEQQWPQKLIDAFFEIGNEYPQLCSEIFAVVKKSKE